jgi:hypothetical protein
MVGFAAERLMELEVGVCASAAYGEKDPERKAQRNGDRERDWQTRAGNVELRIPQLRVLAALACIVVQSGAHRSADVVERRPRHGRFSR